AGAIAALDDRSLRWIDFGSGDEPCVPVSWGDVATAFHSTGVGNITVYFRRTKLFRSADIVAKLFGPLLQSRIGQRTLAAIVRGLPEGPSQAERIGHRATIWAEAIDGSGKISYCLQPARARRPQRTSAEAAMIERLTVKNPAVTRFSCQGCPVWPAAEIGDFAAVPKTAASVVVSQFA